MTDSKNFQNVMAELKNQVEVGFDESSKNQDLGIEIKQGAGIWASLGKDESEAILIEIPASTSAIDTESEELKHKIFPDPEGTNNMLRLWVDDERFKDIFESLCNHLVEKIGITDIENRPESIKSVLSTWRFFWSPSVNRMRKDDEVGLFGELLFLNEWCGGLTDAIGAWTGGGFNSTLRDFQYEKYDIEVKTTAEPPPALNHRIHGLQQLETDPDRKLFIFSCAITESEDGINLNDLLEALREKIQADPDADNTLLGKVGSRGFVPDPLKLRKFESRSQRLYEVDESFPRIVTGSFVDEVPSGIPGDRIIYTLDMHSCDKWLLGEDPPVENYL